MGILKRAIAKDASVVASAVDATDIVAEIERIHKTSAVVTAAAQWEQTVHFLL